MRHDIRLLALVIAHPAAEHDTRHRAQAILFALETELTPDARLTPATPPDLDRALDDLLADCAAAGWA